MKKISLIFFLGIVLMSFIPAYAVGNATLSLSSVNSAAIGDEVTLSLEISDNPGVTVLIFTSVYDKTRLSFMGIEHNTNDSVFSLCRKSETDDKALCVAMGDTSENGKILDLKFKVLDTAVSGRSKVTISVADGDMKNYNKDTITPQISEGYVTIAGQIPPVGVLPTGITVNPSGSVSVHNNSTLQITATVLPANADDKSVSWSSSDPAVASVDANGRVTGVSEGTAVITVTANGNQRVSAQITITVSSQITPPQPPQPQPDSGLNFWRPDDWNRVLPRTGFSAVRPQTLQVKPKNLKYQPLNWKLEIPSLSVVVDILKVPYENGEYSVDWLGDSVGLLEGFAMPGEGYTILAGHNHLNTTEVGPFAFLSSVEIGDRIFVSDDYNELKVFVVYANEKISEDDHETLETIAEKYDDSLTLLTCEDERMEGGYNNRRIVSARPL